MTLAISPDELTILATAWLGAITAIVALLGVAWKRIYPTINGIIDDVRHLKTQQEINKANIETVNNAAPNTVPLIPPVAPISQPTETTTGIQSVIPKQNP